MTSLFSDLVAISPGLGPQAAPGQTQTAPGLAADGPPGTAPEAIPFARVFADLVKQNASVQGEYRSDQAAADRSMPNPKLGADTPLPDQAAGNGQRGSPGLPIAITGLKEHADPAEGARLAELAAAFLQIDSGQGQTNKDQTAENSDAETLASGNPEADSGLSTPDLDVAANLAAELQVSLLPPAQPLSELRFRAVDLGPSLRLITVAAPAPDEASLARFAMSQGIGEPAIRHLLGDKAAMPPLTLQTGEDPLAADSDEIGDQSSGAHGTERSAEMSQRPGSITPLSEELPLKNTEFLAAAAIIGSRTSAAQSQSFSSQTPVSTISIGQTTSSERLIADSITSRPVLEESAPSAALQPEAPQLAAASRPMAADAQQTPTIKLEALAPAAPNKPDAVPAAIVQVLAAQNVSQAQASSRTQTQTADQAQPLSQAAGLAALLMGQASGLQATAMTPDPAAQQASDAAELLPLAVRGLGPTIRQTAATAGSLPSKASLPQQQVLEANAPAPEADIEIDLETLLAPSRQSQTTGGKAALAQDWLASRLAADLGRVESAIELRNALVGADRPQAPNSPPPGNPGQSGLFPIDSRPSTDRSPLPEPQAAVSPGPDDAAADYELLSRRLGEAIAQRLIQQIERGQWQIRFKLTPRSLGDVRVDLQMRNGALEATLLASQSATRDLLNDGLARLRDALSTSGMDVASLSVGPDGSRQDGGKPTPGQMTHHGRAQQTDSGETEGKASVPSPSLGGDGGGWDVLV